MAIFIEYDRDGHEHEGYATQQRTRPIHLERIKHVGGKEREDCTGQGSKQGIGRNGGGGAVE